MERICSRCGSIAIEECPECLEEYLHRKDVKLMAIDERVKEFQSWKKCEIYFDKIHKRLEELVGRPIWTHEFGRWDEIIEEIKSGKHPTLEEILDFERK